MPIVVNVSAASGDTMSVSVEPYEYPNVKYDTQKYDDLLAWIVSDLRGLQGAAEL